ncbi:MAG TPA: hypothetical protein VI818_00505, partial [Candidatus Thermoplasmatota archaeon]|nr:hypothetical protein [Candidatus Thermoplasmatota archaeon]
MARLAFLIAVPLLIVGLAGCLEETKTLTDQTTDVATGLLTPGEPLWYNPQTFPHPAYNYPTLTNLPNGTNVPKWLQPIPAAELPTKITGFQHVARVEGATSGAGMSIVGSIAILPANPTRFVDISDPTKPKAVGSIGVGSRASDTIVYPDGRVVTVIATGQADLVAVDITDPANPVELSRMKPLRGTHKIDIVPGTPIVYNANSKGGDGDPAFGITGNAPALAKGVTEI